MAPQNRIWTLNDVSNYQSVPEVPNSVATTSAAGNKEDAAFLEQDPLMAEYCQPTTTTTTTNSKGSAVPLHHIPTLLSETVCRDTLQRIHNEFYPIIRRRGYNVLSISEFCCCGDGLDYAPAGRRKLRKQHNNVLGYNSTRFGRSKSHTIHLRLRDARNHNRLMPWEDVAGTMAHELSHCVHQNHGPNFYKLMEEILEGELSELLSIRCWGFQVYSHIYASFSTEHASLLVQGMGFQPDFKPSVASSATMPVQGGRKLGGSNAGKSRLLDDSGRRLGGDKGLAASSSSLRDAMARAAEARQRQLQQARRLIERAREPCVIEIIDSDDEDEEENEKNEVTVKRPGHDTGSRNATTKKSKKLDFIDLTSSSPKSDKQNLGASFQHEPPNTISSCIDLTSDDHVDSARSPLEEDMWTCSRCTLQNRPLSLACEVCLVERYKM
eukprot:scaffold22634_cov123-Cylindrotheca_fusiformis.AAC.2